MGRRSWAVRSVQSSSPASWKRGCRNGAPRNPPREIEALDGPAIPGTCAIPNARIAEWRSPFPASPPEVTDPDVPRKGGRTGKRHEQA